MAKDQQLDLDGKVNWKEELEGYRFKQSVRDCGTFVMEEFE